MADQEEVGLIELVERVYPQLDNIGHELEDRPVMMGAIFEASTELEGAAHLFRERERDLAATTSSAPAEVGDDKAASGGKQELPIAGAPDKEQHRAMVIAYTALWQLREIDTLGEPEDFREARIELRRRLDEVESAASAAPMIQLTRKERNLLSAEVDVRLEFAGDELSSQSSGVSASAAATTIGRLKALRDCLGWELKVGKRKGKRKQWPVPADVLADALDYLIDQRRGDLIWVNDKIEDLGPHQLESEAEEREGATRISGLLSQLLDIASKAKGGRSR